MFFLAIKFEADLWIHLFRTQSDRHKDSIGCGVQLKVLHVVQAAVPPVADNNEEPTIKVEDNSLPRCYLKISFFGLLLLNCYKSQYSFLMSIWLMVKDDNTLYLYIV